jgi:hypothetical protein
MLYRIWRAAMLSALLVCATAASAQPVGDQSVVGCWETARDALDHRRICIGPDLSVQLTTMRVRGGADRCDTYPSARANVSAGGVQFVVPSGRGNCLLSSGSVVDSVEGTFDCDLSGDRFLACRTSWLGYPTILETYVRQ